MIFIFEPNGSSLRPVKARYILGEHATSTKDVVPVPIMELFSSIKLDPLLEQLVALTRPLLQPGPEHKHLFILSLELLLKLEKPHITNTLLLRLHLKKLKFFRRNASLFCFSLALCPNKVETSLSLSLRLHLLKSRAQACHIFLSLLKLGVEKVDVGGENLVILPY